MSSYCLLSPHLISSDAMDHKDFSVAPEVSLLCSIFVTAAPSPEDSLALALHLSAFSHPLASENTYSETESVILLMTTATSRLDWNLTNWGDVSDERKSTLMKTTVVSWGPLVFLESSRAHVTGIDSTPHPPSRQERPLFTSTREKSVNKTDMTFALMPIDQPESVVQHDPVK